ncbi:uncharacterized protein PHACADRAFT_156470 [Phanerochaete carnosa HHB-10118-sp]|uniref:Uncharacterized protein n=1 Tax=Phanerochaete carnosa (strain HHB-10118-sp) TaxID=650164 RepID=K5WPS2_PHACS|nr:uncharacterized protein PHACADRAFT_156470 [Phanerochaete carnosa HHB-10118-sp]EKM61244.1 hypothetical protein PHACADRAFT_156470 [Phanerochaete carnosa HHB-10118-sp]
MSWVSCEYDAELLSSIEHLTKLKKKQARTVSAGKRQASRTARSVRRAIGHTGSNGVAVEGERQPTPGAASVARPHDSSTTSCIPHAHARCSPTHQTDFPADTNHDRGP